MATLCAEYIIICIYSVVQRATPTPLLEVYENQTAIIYIYLYNLYLGTRCEALCEENDIGMNKYMCTAKMN